MAADDVEQVGKVAQEMVDRVEDSPGKPLWDQIGGPGETPDNAPEEMTSAEWESVGDVDRLKVPGGWLVASRVAMCFVSDPMWLWRDPGNPPTPLGM